MEMGGADNEKNQCLTLPHCLSAQRNASRTAAKAVIQDVTVTTDREMFWKWIVHLT
jgi:hypothetical protein